MISSSQRSQTNSLRSSVESKEKYDQKSRRSSFVENLILEYKTQSNKKRTNHSFNYDEQSISLKQSNNKSKVAQLISNENKQTSSKRKLSFVNQPEIHFPLKEVNCLQSYKSTQIKQERNLLAHNMTLGKSGSQSKGGNLTKNPKIMNLDSQYESQLLRNIYHNNNSNNTRREQLFKRPKRVQGEADPAIATTVIRGRNDRSQSQSENLKKKTTREQSWSCRLREELSESFDRNIKNCIECLISERLQDGLNLLLAMKKSLKDFVLGTATTNLYIQNSSVMQQIHMKQFISLCLYDLFVVVGGSNVPQKQSSTSSQAHSNKIGEKLQKKYILLRDKLKVSEQQSQNIMVVETFYMLTKVNQFNKSLLVFREQNSSKHEEIDKLIDYLKQSIQRMRNIITDKQEWFSLKLFNVLYHILNPVIDNLLNNQMILQTLRKLIQYSKALLTYTFDLQDSQSVKSSSGYLLYLSLLITKIITQTLFIISNRIQCQLSRKSQLTKFRSMISKQTPYLNTLYENLTQSHTFNWIYESSRIDQNIISSYLNYLRNFYRTVIQQFVLSKAILITIIENQKQTKINNNSNKDQILLFKHVITNLQPQIKLLNQYGKELYFNHNQNLLSPNNNQKLSSSQIKINDQYVFCAIHFSRLFVTYYQTLQDIDCMMCKLYLLKECENLSLFKRISILETLRSSILRINWFKDNILINLQLWAEEKVMKVYYQLGEISSLGEVVIQHFVGRLRRKVQQYSDNQTQKENTSQLPTNDYYNNIITQPSLYSLYISYKSTVILSNLSNHSDCSTNEPQIDLYKKISQLNLRLLIEEVEKLSQLGNSYTKREEQQQRKRKDLLKVFVELQDEDEDDIGEDINVGQQLNLHNCRALSQQQFQIVASLTLANLSIQLLRHYCSHEHQPISTNSQLQTFTDDDDTYNQSSTDSYYNRSHTNTVYMNDPILLINQQQLITAIYLQQTKLNKPTQYHTNRIKSTIIKVSRLLSQNNLSFSKRTLMFTNILNDLKQSIEILQSYIHHNDM